MKLAASMMAVVLMASGCSGNSDPSTKATASQDSATAAAGEITDAVEVVNSIDVSSEEVVTPAGSEPVTKPSVANSGTEFPLGLDQIPGSTVTLANRDGDTISVVLSATQASTEVTDYYVKQLRAAGYDNVVEDDSDSIVIVTAGHPSSEISLFVGVAKFTDKGVRVVTLQGPAATV